MSDEARETKPGNPPEPEEQTDFTCLPSVAVVSPLAATTVGAVILREQDDASI